ncbi:MAG: YiiD C-terminal domain-containing protein, partial [Lentisphaeria bacterium]
TTCEENNFAADIAVYKSSCDYFSPASHDLLAIATISKVQLSDFTSLFEKNKKASLEVNINIFSNNTLCAKFSGKYAIRPKYSIR